MVMAHTNRTFIRWIGIGNLLNLVLFQLLFIVAWMLRPGYSPIRQPASDLGIGPFGAWVDAGVIVLALLKISLAIGLFIAMRPILSAPWRWICAILVALPGVGNIVTAVFTEAPQSLVIHSLASAVVVLVCPITFLLVGTLFWRTPGWQGLGVFSVLAGVGWYLYTWASGADVPPLNQRGRPVSARRESTLSWTS
jgi:hypothetical protein